MTMKMNKKKKEDDKKDEEEVEQGTETDRKGRLFIRPSTTLIFPQHDAKQTVVLTPFWASEMRGITPEGE